jgi:molybdopterin-guanine dinucleotide biosynthesis protein A
MLELFMKSCIILCGGWARRMGQDKGLMYFQDKPLIIHVLDKVKTVANEIILILRDYNQLNKYEKVLEDSKENLTIHTDLIKDQGPLAGIYTGLTYINSSYALIIPCDSPLIQDSFIEKIFSFINNEYDAVVPQWPDGHLEPLHALYHKRNIKIIKEHLNEGRNDVKSLLEKLKVKYVNVDLLDETGQSFRNLNQPKDLKIK